MNNKGFAITGILYTLFVLFVMILLSILATISYKKGVLEKTVSGLENSFKLTEVTDNINTTYIIDAETEERITTKNGKYEFSLKYIDIDGNTQTKICSFYTKNDQIIPTTINPESTDDFVLVPADCNDYPYEVLLPNETPLDEYNKLILKNVYEFKG